MIRFFFLLSLFLLPVALYSQSTSRDEEKSELQKAIESHNLEKVKQLVVSGADINENNKWRETPMIYAIKSNDIPIVKYLLSKQVNERDGMHYAANLNNTELVQLLINNNFTVGQSLIYAAENNNFPMVKMLVTAGANVNQSQKRKRRLFSKYYVTAIEMAVKNSNKQMTLYLVDNGVKLSTALDEAFDHHENEILKELIDRSSNLDELMLHAFTKDNGDIITYLISKGANANYTDKDGNTLLHVASKSGSTFNTALCIEKYKIDVDIKNDVGMTPLMMAALYNNADVVRYLLDKNANLEAVDNNGETALFHSMRCKTMDIFNLLILNGANPKHKTNDNSTLLIVSAKNEQFAAVNYLIQNGAELNAENDHGINAFQYVISPYNRNKDLVKIFLDNGADINTRDAKDGKSLMYYAIGRNDLPKIKELYNLGADIDPRDSKGARPDADKSEVIHYLIDNGADIDALDRRHDSYLCAAVRDNDLELAHYLISKGIDVNQNCYFDEPPLIKAIEAENITLVKFLVDNGANINAVGYFDRNVMEYAEKEGNQEIIDYLKSKGALSKVDKNERYRKSIELEGELKSALSLNDEEKLVASLKKTENLVIQESLIKRIAIFAGEKGNPIVVELLISKLDFNLEKKLNSSDQNILMIATINDQTSLVSYLLNKGIDINIEDSNGNSASQHAKNKVMKKLYKDLK